LDRHSRCALVERLPVSSPSLACAIPGHRPGAGWTLIIDEQDLTFIAAGGQPIRQPKPQVIIGFAGDIYQTPRIGVNIVHAPCNDVMSGQGYRDRVQVDVDGKRYEGCGGDLTTPAP